jgi:hypothetical protein
MSFQMAVPSSTGGARLGGRRAATLLETAIGKLKELGINLLALDFDQTILDIHTGGQWKGTAEELVPHVRPELRQLMQACCHHHIHLCVVTFSGQIKLVRSVVEAIVGPEHAAHIPIRGNDRSWSYEGAGSRSRKQAHIASAVEELEQQEPRPQQVQMHTPVNGGTNNDNAADADAAGPSDPTSPPPSSPIEITRKSTLLIDDDIRNVRVALNDGVRAIWFDPDKPHHLLQNIARLV